MQWITPLVISIVVIGTAIGTYIHVVERRADRAIRREELIVENKKADAALQNAENDRYKLATDRSRMELDYSRDSRLTSATLDDEHRRLHTGHSTDLVTTSDTTD